MQQVTKVIRECLRTFTQCMSWLWLSMYWHDTVHSPLFYTKGKPDQVRTPSISKCIFCNIFDSIYWKKRSASPKIPESALLKQIWNWFYFPKKQRSQNCYEDYFILLLTCWNFLAELETYFYKLHSPVYLSHTENKQQ